MRKMTIKFEDNEMKVYIKKITGEIKIELEFKKGVDDFMVLPKKYFSFEGKRILRYQCGFMYNTCVYIFILDIDRDSLNVIDFVLPRICLNDIIKENVKVGG